MWCGAPTPNRWWGVIISDEEWRRVCSEASATEGLRDHLSDPQGVHQSAGKTHQRTRALAMHERLGESVDALKDTELLDGHGFAHSGVKRDTMDWLEY